MSVFGRPARTIGEVMTYSTRAIPLNTVGITYIPFAFNIAHLFLNCCWRRYL